MDISPTTLHKSKFAKTKVVAFDTELKKPIGVFCSLHECARLFFETPTSTTTTRGAASSKINHIIKAKKIDTSNVFGKPITFRAADEKYKAMLGDAEKIIFLDEYENKTFDERMELKSGGYKSREDYALDDVLKEGDLVKLKYGAYAGIVTEILAIQPKGGMTPGRFNYAIETPGGIHTYKSNVLELVKKCE